MTEDQIAPEHRMDVSVSARAAVENEAFLRCLDASTEKRRAVSHNQGVNYAPKVFAAMPEGKGFNEAAFKQAFERLLYLRLIELDQALWQRANRAWKYGIKRAENRAPSRTHRAPTRTDPSSQVIDFTCTDPRTEPVHRPAPTPSQVIDFTCTDPHAPTPLYTTYISGAADTAPDNLDDEMPL